MYSENCQDPLGSFCKINFIPNVILNQLSLNPRHPSIDVSTSPNPTPGCQVSTQNMTQNEHK